MPTRARKLREAERQMQEIERRKADEEAAAELAAFDRQLAEIPPAQLEAIQRTFNGSDELIFELPVLPRWKGGLGGVDEYGDVWTHENVGRAGSAANADRALDQAKTLKRKYLDIWGKRGYAKKIAAESEQTIREKLSVETIRRYFKKLP